MLRPKLPTMPHPTGTAPPAVIQPTTITPGVQSPSAPAALGPASTRPAAQLTPGTALALVGGAVLVSMLLAVAVTAASVAVCAVVLRSLMSQHRC